jgi:hypothetical protein
MAKEILPWYSPDTLATIRLDSLHDLLSRLDDLPDIKKETDTPKGYRSRPWTEDEDSALLRFWPKKVQREIARIMKRSMRSCLDRFEYLTNLEQECREKGD